MQTKRNSLIGESWASTEEVVLKQQVVKALKQLFTEDEEWHILSVNCKLNILDILDILELWLNCP